MTGNSPSITITAPDTFNPPASPAIPDPLRVGTAPSVADVSTNNTALVGSPLTVPSAAPSGGSPASTSSDVTGVGSPDSPITQNSPAPPPQTPQAGTTPADSFAVRVLRVTLQIQGGQKFTFSGLRVAAQIEFASAPYTGVASIRIYGLTLDHINALSKAGNLFGYQDNTVLVEAGNEGGSLAQVFKGITQQAYPDMNSQPDASFVVIAFPATDIQLTPVQATSFSGATPVGDALTAIAAKGGYKIENNGVNAVFQSPYFAGSAWAQMMAAVRAANAEAYIDGQTKTLAIWPKFKSRGGGTTTISPATGMIGYPSFQKTQVTVRTIYNTENKLWVGQPIKIDSQLKAANGVYTVHGLTHNLESQAADGPWETAIVATPVNSGPP